MAISPITEDILTLIEFILTKNSFILNKTYYLQIQGTVMGTNMSPSYANILMEHLEEQKQLLQKYGIE